MSNRRMFDAETERRIVDDYEAGMPILQMTGKYCSGLKALYSVLERNGVTLRGAAFRQDMDRIREVCPSAAAAMEEKGMTCEELAERVGYCYVYARSILVGNVGMPGVFARYTSEALGIDHAQMIKEADNWWHRNKPGERRRTKRMRESEMSDEMIAQIVAEYKAGEEPVHVIARKWGICSNRVTQMAKRAGCVTRVGRRHMNYTDELKQAIVRDYENGMRIAFICSKHDVPANRVYEAVKEAGCKMRYFK